jgi:hypothetical protein
MLHDVQILLQRLWSRSQRHINDLCEWLLQQEAASPTFLSRVLLIEEACFTRNAILTISDEHTRYDGNPHSFEETQFHQ